MQKRSLATLVVLSSVALTAVGARALQAATELARINNAVITLESFNQKYRENLKFFQFKAPTRKGVLDDLIKRELGIQEAKKLGLDRDPEVQDRMNTVLYHALLDKKLSKQFEAIQVSDDDARRYYSTNPELRTSHIFVALRPDAPKDQVKKAYEKIKKIQDDYLRDGKMSFAEVAQRFSEGVAAPMGGDIDYQTRDKLDPVYYDTAVRLRTPGKVSGIIRTQFGYHIVKLTAIRPWDEADKAQIKRLVFDERRSQIFERYMAQLRAAARVTVHSALLGD
jgi:parvulin-like peptidyl-prolyl isomerase